MDQAFGTGWLAFLVDTRGCALTLTIAFSRINLLIRLFKAQPLGGWNDAAAIGQPGIEIVRTSSLVGWTLSM